MQRINTNLSPLQCWRDLSSFLTYIVLLSHFVASFFAMYLWQLTHHYFHLSNHCNFCQLWICDLRTFLPGLFVSANLPRCDPFITLLYAFYSCLSFLLWIFFFNPESHQQAVSNAVWSHCFPPFHNLVAASHSWRPSLFYPHKKSFSFYFQRDTLCNLLTIISPMHLIQKERPLT